jgi:phage gp37-like protein
MRDVVDTQSDRSAREAGVAERTKLANLFAAIGNATNETIQYMPEFSDEGVRRQMMHTFAAVGGFVMYADMLQHSTMKASSQASSESSAAVIQLGRALSRRIEIKDV